MKINGKTLSIKQSNNISHIKNKTKLKRQANGFQRKPSNLLTRKGKLKACLGEMELEWLNAEF